MQSNAHGASADFDRVHVDAQLCAFGLGGSLRLPRAAMHGNTTAKARPSAVLPTPSTAPTAPPMQAPISEPSAKPSTTTCPSEHASVPRDAQPLPADHAAAVLQRMCRTARARRAVAERRLRLRTAASVSECGQQVTESARTGDADPLDRRMRQTADAASSTRSVHDGAANATIESKEHAHLRARLPSVLALDVEDDVDEVPNSIALPGGQCE